MASLARDYDVRRDTISALLRRHGVTIRQQRAMTENQIDEAAQLYERGLSLMQIGTRLGWDNNTIHTQLKKRGVRMRGPHDRRR